MGWFDEETGAERAVRIKGENQAAEHARKQDSKQDDYERRQYERWENDNGAYKKAEYAADLAAARKPGYERLYRSPADVDDLPGEPFFTVRRTETPAAPQSDDMPVMVKIGAGCILGPHREGHLPASPRAPGRAPGPQERGEVMAASDRSSTEETARRDRLEAGFQFVLTHDAELLQRLEDA
jgi:hypothetical protein